jgi:membrane protease YdiL (CAAX protease family)
METERVEPGYSQWRCLTELGICVLSLVVLARFFPLGSRGFSILTPLLSVIALVYVISRLRADRDLAARWGFQLARRVDSIYGWDAEQEVSGCVTLLLTLFAGFLPPLFVRLFTPHSIYTNDPASYLLWCGVQDFLFFGLILTNVEDLAGSAVAIILTALLFGFSHFPYSTLMSLTTVAGGVWSYAFLQSRSLPMITVAHWLMGLVLLG